MSEERANEKENVQESSAEEQDTNQSQKAKKNMKTKHTEGSVIVDDNMDPSSPFK